MLSQYWLTVVVYRGCRNQQGGQNPTKAYNTKEILMSANDDGDDDAGDDAHDDNDDNEWNDASEIKCTTYIDLVSEKSHGTHTWPWVVKRHGPGLCHPCASAENVWMTKSQDDNGELTVTK